MTPIPVKRRVMRRSCLYRDFLVLPEQAKVLAELEQVAKLHLALVYRGTTDGARQFIEAQDALIQESYAEPEEDPIEEGEAADPTAEMPESEVTG